MNPALHRGRTAVSSWQRATLKSSNPEIALLLSTFQRPTHLKRALLSIAMQEGVEGRVELVVTDDGSTDETPQIVRRFAESVDFPVSFTTHRHETFQLARCRNEGARASSAPYLLFLDSDCVLPPDHVRKHLEHRRPGCVMSGYCCVFDQATSARVDEQVIRSREYLDWAPPSQLRALAKRRRKTWFYQLIRHRRKTCLAGGNIGIWRSDFERVNGQDENFEGWGSEDDDLGMRLRRAGIRIASILPWTHTYHLWHPRTATAPERIRDGANISYLHRRCRLTKCISGLVERTLADLAVSVAGTPSWPEAAAAFLASQPLRLRQADHPEVELLFLPGKGHFSSRADCRVLVVLEDSPQAVRLAGKAHLVISDRPYHDAGRVDHFPPSRFAEALGRLVGRRCRTERQLQEADCA